LTGRRLPILLTLVCLIAVIPAFMPRTAEGSIPQTSGSATEGFVEHVRVFPTDDDIMAVTRLDLVINAGRPCAFDDDATLLYSSEWLGSDNPKFKVTGGTATLTQFPGIGMCASRGDGGSDPAGITFLEQSVLGPAILRVSSGDASPDPPRLCPFGDVTVVAARGSGESESYWEAPPDDPDLVFSGRYGAAVFRELGARLDPLGVAVDLVSVDYPAIPVPGFFQVVVSPNDYADSVLLGVESVLDEVATIATTPGCGPDHPVVFVGYSQGAHVVQIALDLLAGSAYENMVASAGLFASPMFTNDDETARGSFDRTATGVSSLIPFLPSAANIPGVFGASTRSWCLAGDIVCDASFGNLDDMIVHTGYLYGVSSDGRILGSSSAATDIVNTAVWALDKRGTIDSLAERGLTTGVPRLDSFDESAFHNSYAANLWISAANVSGTRQPVSSYLWDLDNDGVYEIAGASPTIVESYDRTYTGNPSDTHVIVGVRTIGPSSLSAEFRACWDLRLAEPCAADLFSDDDGSVFEPDIEWMARQGITKGCNPPSNDMFCPDSSLTRGQMAAFLVRALNLTERLDDPFIDDDDSVFEADIEKLAAAGITRGCNPPENDRFCPDAKVRREVLAAFLVRALD
jgi:hypothetical protein